MVGKLKWLELLLISLAGLFSLLATSPPPPNFVQFVTSNNSREGDYWYPPLDSAWYACKDENVKLVWGLFTPDSVVVTTNPTDAFQPKLENKTLRDSGEMELTFLKPTKLVLKYSENPLEYTINELSEDICTGFPVAPVVGKYTGTFAQNLPQLATLESQLQLIWAENRLNARVDGRALFPCTFDAVTDSVTCAEGDDAAPTFKLEGQFVEGVFEGNYRGIAETAGVRTSFAGTFSYSKTLPE